MSDETAGLGNGTTEDWRAPLPDELRASPALKDIPDMATLAKSFVDQQAFLGNAIRPPGPEASEEQKADFYRKLQDHAGDMFMPRPDPEDAEQMAALAKAMGRPDEASAYAPPEAPEGSIPIDEARFNAFREVAHKAGLTQKQVEAIVAAELESGTAAYNEQMNALKQSRLDLQREWGLTFDERNKSARDFAAQTGAPKELLDAIEKGQVNGETLKWIHTMQKAIGGESPEISKQPTTSSGAVDPTEANLRVAEITEQLTKMPPSDPKYEGLMKKRMDYMKMANPDAATTLDNLRAGAGDVAPTFDESGQQY